MPFVIIQVLETSSLHPQNKVESFVRSSSILFLLTQGSWINTTDDIKLVICLHISAVAFYYVAN